MRIHGGPADHKLPLGVSLGSDTTLEERRAIEGLLCDLRVNFTEDINRPTPLGDLPLLVEFTLGAAASGVLYDVLKSSIIRLVKFALDSPKSKRDLVISVSEREVQIATEGRLIIFHSKEGEIEFQAIDDLEGALSSFEASKNG
jgi:hypothetical protein